MLVATSEVRLARPACSKGVLPLRVLSIEQILSEATDQQRRDTALQIAMEIIGSDPSPPQA